MALGDLYDPLGTHLDDPFSFYARARESEPLFYSPAIDAWVVTRLDDVRKVLRDGKTYSSANALKPFRPFNDEVLAELAKGYPPRAMFITMDGEEHRRLRTPATAGLSAERVAAVEPFITERATALLPELSGEHVDFMAAYANRLPVDVICHLVGFPLSESQALGDDSRAAASLSMGHRFKRPGEELDAARAWVRFQRQIARQINEHRREPRDDIIGDLLKAYAPGDGPLTPTQEADLVGLVFSVALPGHITTSALLGNGLLRLLNTGQWKLLCERPDLVPNAVEEILRYDSPTHVFLRVTTRETTLAGHTLPPGTELAVWLVNRDETAPSHPNEFDITRPVQPGHIAFGHGAHFCPGAALARRQAEISLRLLTQRYPSLRLTPGQQIQYRPSLDHHGPDTLLIDT